MKNKQWKRFLALIMVICMMMSMSISANAALFDRSGTSDFLKGWGSFIQSIWGGWNNQDTDESVQEETPVVEEETAASESSVMTLEEDASTVDNGEMLRASTYSLRSAAATAAEEGLNLKYFPITLYDYDTDTINNATHQLEVEANQNLTEWQGLYFSDGAPGASAYTYTLSSESHDNLTWAQILEGEYYADEDCIVAVKHETITSYKEAGSLTYNDVYTNQSMYYYMDDEGYHQITVTIEGVWLNYSYTYIYTINVDGEGIASGEANDSVSVKLYTASTDIAGYTANINGNEYTLNGTDTSVIFPVSPLYTKASTGTTDDSLEYAAWNWWNKKSGDNNNGQKTYTGLVESRLDGDKNLVFTVPQADIFSADETNKIVYTNVELPFAYDKTTNFYTFDASQNGVYFHEDATQMSDGTAGDNTRLYYDETYTQSNGGTYGDGSNTVWAPFNNGTDLTVSTMNYHFGMRANVPFQMTEDGRMPKPATASAETVMEPIQFTFSGDDDVWVFIDGYLVIDLGGIHNRLNAEIDFAENKVTYSENNNSTADIGSFNDTDFATEQTLFGNLIPQDRASFAANKSHELTIFYLERGQGSSNGQIMFNLPVYDYVEVRKSVAGVAKYDSNDDTLSTTDSLTELSADRLAAINNVDFSFILYKKNGDAFEPVTGATYLLLNESGQTIATPATGSDGSFTLKNNQTARFITQFTTEDSGDTYYVQEKVTNGFVYTSYVIDSTGSTNTHQTDESVGAASYSYGKESGSYYLTNMDFSTKMNSNGAIVTSASEGEDHVTFTAKNYVNLSTPTPFAIAYDKTIVIDYGLPVEIDLSTNKYFVGDTYSIALDDSTALNYGTAVLNGDVVTYTLTKQLTGIEKIGFTVYAQATDTDNNAVYSAPAKATIYIVPATTMYYEENFGMAANPVSGDFVQTSKLNGVYQWKVEGSATNALQEPGVVKTASDSTYGSDIAYLDDSRDSNGTSLYLDTSSSAGMFRYTFTGTGTAFYARTSDTTGTYCVKITDKDNDVVYEKICDTRYKDTDGEYNILLPLYNIPVFNYTELDYGTYTVTVTIYKGSSVQENWTTTVVNGSEFWLDGIRVYNPMVEGVTDYSIAANAYAEDGESNLVIETLRNKIINDNTAYVESEEDEDGKLVWTDGSAFVLFTDSNGEIKSADEYQSNGPKQEVYLYNGQSVSFTLRYVEGNVPLDVDDFNVYLGMKVPTGSGTVSVGSHSIELSNAADCYFNIKDYATVEYITENGVTYPVAKFTITAGADDLISLTNIKVTGNAQFGIIDAGGDVEVDGSEAGE